MLAILLQNARKLCYFKEAMAPYYVDKLGQFFLEEPTPLPRVAIHQEEAVEAEKSSSTSVLGAIALPVVFLASVGGLVYFLSRDLGSSAPTYRPNPLARKARIPSLQEIVQVEGVDYRIAKDLQRFLAQGAPSPALEAWVKETFASEFLEVTPNGARSPIALFLNLGSRSKPSLAYVTRSVTLEGPRAQRIQAGDWAILPWDVLLRAVPS
jgi:hypothetical protein